MYVNVDYFFRSLVICLGGVSLFFLAARPRTMIGLLPFALKLSPHVNVRRLMNTPRRSLTELKSRYHFRFGFFFPRHNVNVLVLLFWLLRLSILYIIGKIIDLN